MNISWLSIWSVSAFLQQLFQHAGVYGALHHRVHVLRLAYPAPVHALLQALLQDQVKPEPGAPAVAVHERVGHVHLHVFVHDLVERILGHPIDRVQSGAEEVRYRELEAAFRDVLLPDLSGEIVQASEQLGVDLLRARGGTYFDAFDERTLEKGICFCPAFPVHAFIVVHEPL